MASNLFRGSNHAQVYSKFRPSPPNELINSIITYLRTKISSTFKLAIDIGCGSGQSTIAIAPYFEKVIGYDISEAQIECARKERSAINVEYKVLDCVSIPCSDSSVQLVTSSQAIHWFDTSKIFKDVKRVLIPNGVVAVYGYWIPLPITNNQEKDKKLAYLIEEKFHETHLGKYWNDERYIVKNKYADVNFPFKDVQRLDLIKKSQSSLADYLGYLSSWSAYQKLMKTDEEKAENILKSFKEECIEILDIKKTPEEIEFTLHTDYFMLMGHS